MIRVELTIQPPTKCLKGLENTAGADDVLVIPPLQTTSTPHNMDSAKRKQHPNLADASKKVKMVSDNNNDPSSSSVDISDEESGARTWARPGLPLIDPNVDSIIFLQFDADYTVGNPLPGMPGATTGSVPIVRLWGVNEIGNSVQCNIHGFTPYFYVQAPEDFKENHCEMFRQTLNVSTNNFATT